VDQHQPSPAEVDLKAKFAALCKQAAVPPTPADAALAKLTEGHAAQLSELLHSHLKLHGSTVELLISAELTSLAQRLKAVEMDVSAVKDVQQQQGAVMLLMDARVVTLEQILHNNSQVSSCFPGPCRCRPHYQPSCAGPTPLGLQADQTNKAPLDRYLEQWWDEEEPSWELRPSVSEAEFLDKLLAHLRVYG
jgi:hypothetical protein